MQPFRDPAEHRIRQKPETEPERAGEPPMTSGLVQAALERRVKLSAEMTAKRARIREQRDAMARCQEPECHERPGSNLRLRAAAT